MADSSIKIAVAVTPGPSIDRAERLSRELGIPQCQPPCGEFDYTLVYNDGCGSPRLELLTTRADGPGPIYVDFVKGALGFRTRHGTRGKEPLTRAVGLKGAVVPTVLDATAGLGRDAFILATLGCRVTMVERSPFIAALLRDGLERALATDDTRAAAERMCLDSGDAITVMKQCDARRRPDVVYLDPMYPHRSKSALVKKEMRLLRALVGEDLDAPRLLESALCTAGKRVVVKRPRLAAALPGVAPSHSLVGSTTRFDIYLCASTPGEG